LLECRLNDMFIKQNVDYHQSLKEISQNDEVQIMMLLYFLQEMNYIFKILMDKY
jgi:hypothetical protein